MTFSMRRPMIGMVIDVTNMLIRILAGTIRGFGVQSVPTWNRRQGAVRDDGDGVKSKKIRRQIYE